MSWKYVFNSNLKRWGHQEKCMNAAKASGYDYYSWNGWVYNVDEHTHMGIKIENLK